MVSMDKQSFVCRAFFQNFCLPDLMNDPKAPELKNLGSIKFAHKTQEKKKLFIHFFVTQGKMWIKALLPA